MHPLLAHHLVEAIPFVVPALVIPGWLAAIVVSDRLRKRK